VADQPKDLYGWAPTRQAAWFATQFETVMPVTLNEDDGFIPFTKLMQINKIMHPRLNTEYLERRRELYKAKDWEAYERCVRDSFR